MVVSAMWSRAILSHRSRLMHDVPRPPSDGVVHAGGPGGERVLLIGGGPAVGWGVLTHEVALAGHLARRVARDLDSGVDVVVHADPRMLARDLPDALEHLDDLSSFSAAVITVGVNDALTATATSAWTTSLRRALGVLEASGIDPARVVLLGIQTVSTIPTYAGRVGARADRHRNRLNAASSRLLSRAGCARLAMLSDPQPGTDRYRDSTVYAQWAGDLAPAVVAALRDHRQAIAPSGDDGRARIQDLLTHAQVSGDTSIEAVLVDVRAHFRASWAGLVVVDERGERTVVSSGARPLPDPGVLARNASQMAGPIVVYDARRDERTRADPIVYNGGPQFFAAMPVEALEHERIGALCVADPDVRTVIDVDVTVLRDAARRIQAYLRSAASRDR